MAPLRFITMPIQPQQQQPLTIYHAAFAATTLLLFGFTMFMCASHSRKLRGWTACYRADSHDPVIHVNNDHLMNFEGVFDPYGDPSTAFSGPVWQKNILMGGKCQLPDFSGVIMYDSEGNVVPPAKNRPLLTWK